MDRSPLFEVTTAASAGDTRRLTTAANVRAIIGSPAGDDILLTTFIDRASASIARECGLAADVAGAIPTLGRETCRATWFVDNYECDGRPLPLRLPWRTPITSITSVVEDGATLEAADFQLMPGGLLYRLSSDTRIGWSGGKVVVVFVAGFVLPTGVPPDLEEAAIQQVKYLYNTRGRDDSLLSEAVPDVYQASYGDSRSWVGESGLLAEVENKLAPYKNWATS